MKSIPVEKLRPIPKLPTTLLHKSGIVLLRPGEALKQEMIAKLKELEVREVFLLGSGERPEEARHQLMHVAMSVQELQAGDTLARSIYDQEGHLLLEEGASIPANLAASLERRGIATIYFKKSEEHLRAKVGRRAKAAIADLLAGTSCALVEKEVVEDIKRLELVEASPDELDARKLAAKIDRLHAIEVVPKGEPFSKQVRDTRKRGPASGEEKRDFSDATDESLKDIKQVMAMLKNGVGGVMPTLDRVATRVMAGLIRNRDLLMLCGTCNGREEDYFPHHALAVVTISINIATVMGYGGAQVKALAYGALLADVGLLKLPPGILNQNRKLTPGEMAEIRRHPSLGMDIIESIPRIPVEVPYIIYQSHEKANGGGYPGGKKDMVIHPFAKIVHVADTYAAMIADRPYRKAKLPYEVMEALVLACGKRELNAATVRAFLACNSMFPVGSYVCVSDGRCGRVVAANPENYMKPIVAMLCDAGKRALPEPERVDLLAQDSLTVKAALAPTDLPVPIADEMAGF